MKSIIRLLCLISISTLLIFFSEIAVAITAETPEQTSFNFYDWAYVLTEIIFGLLVIAITLAGYVFYQNRKLKAELSKSQQHEDRLRTLYTAIEQSPVSVVIAGVDAYIRYVNPQFTAVTGYSPIEVIGQNPRILSSGLTSPAVYQAMWSALSKGVPWSGEFINRRKNGEIYWEQAYISPVYNKAGQITQYVAVKLDITERKRRELHEHSHNQVLELLSKGAPLKTILLAIVRGVEAEYPNMMCSVLLLDKEEKHLLYGAAPSLPEFYNEAINGAEIGFGVGSCGTAAFTGKRVIVADIATHSYWTAYAKLAESARLGACWSEPIYGSKNKVLGTFAIYHHEQHIPKAEDIRLIEESANLAAIAIERFQAAEALRLSEEKHRWLAHYDMLTELPNRMLFSDRLKQAIRLAKRYNKKLAVMFLDLDKFKPVNDGFGHAVGDLMLKEVAYRMQQCVRESDTVCRIGGDEFVILIPEVADEDDPLQIAEKIRQSLNQPFALAGQQLHISCSIGIALYPEHGTDELMLTKNADLAMYRAKENGRNQAQVF